MKMSEENKYGKSCENACKGKVANECQKTGPSFGRRVASEAIGQMACETDDVVDFVFMCNEAGKDPMDVVESICRRNGFHYADEKGPEDPDKARLFKLMRDVVDALSSSKADAGQCEEGELDDGELADIVRCLVDHEIMKIVHHVFL